MIIGDLNKWTAEEQAYAPILRKALDYLRTTDFTDMEYGKYPLLGEDMFALVQKMETVPVSERQAEHHAKYLDVQLIVRGEEVHGVARQSEGNVPVKDELETNDYALFDNVANEFEILLKEGMFAVYFPDDIHRPGCTRTTSMITKRVVIKINKALLSTYA